MATPDNIEAVKKVSEAMSKQSPAEELERMAPNKEHFQSLIDTTQVKAGSIERVDTKAFSVEEAHSEKMQVFADDNVTSQKSGSATDQEKKKKQTEEIEGVSGSKKSVASKSLMEEVGKVESHGPKISKADPGSIKDQAKGVIDQIEQVKDKLKTQTDIKPSYQTLLRNRLSHIDDNVKIALNKAGIEYTPATNVAEAGKANPAQRFLNLLSNSQHQLENLHSTIESLSMTGAQISPANMLAIQMKMGYVQQQIELFTSLLNKALESTKTIMNVQV